MPAGGIGRVLIYKTYKDPRTYQVYDEANAAVRHSGRRHHLGAQSERLPARRHSPEGLRVSVVERRRADEHAARRPARAALRQSERLEQSADDSRAQDDGRRSTPTPFTDMFFDDVKTLYDLDDPRRTRSASSRSTATSARATSRRSICSATRRSRTSTVIDLDTAKPLRDVEDREMRPSSSSRCRSSTTSRARISRSTARSTIRATRSSNGVLTFDRTVKGLRNTILLPAGWDVTSVSQSANDRALSGSRVRRAGESERRELVSRRDHGEEEGALRKIKATYLLDQDTVRPLHRIASRWGVCKSEALRRVIRSAATRSARTSGEHHWISRGRPVCARSFSVCARFKNVCASRGRSRFLMLANCLGTSQRFWNGHKRN